MNNREKAYLIIFIIFLLYLLLYKKTRNSIFRIINIAIFFKLGILLFLYCIYFSFIVFILRYIGLWHVSNLQITIFWYITIGLYNLYSLNFKDNKQYLKKQIVSVFSGSFLFSFIINLFSFSLIGEILFLIIMLFLTLLQTATKIKSKKERKFILINQILENIILIISFLVLIYSLLFILGAPEIFFNEKNAITYLLIISFTLFTIPCLYLIKLYTCYESLFVRIKYTNKKTNPKILKKIYRDIIKYSQLSLSKVSYLSQKSKLWNIDNKDYLQTKLKEINKENKNILKI